MLDYGFVCERARREAGGGLRASGIASELEFPEFPAVVESLTLVAAFPPGGKRGRLEVRLVRDGETVFAEPVSQEVPDKMLLTLKWVLFDVPGEYRFELLAGGRLVGVVPLRVSRASGSRRGVA